MISKSFLSTQEDIKLPGSPELSLRNIHLPRVPAVLASVWAAFVVSSCGPYQTSSTSDNADLCPGGNKFDRTPHPEETFMAPVPTTNPAPAAPPVQPVAPIQPVAPHATTGTKTCFPLYDSQGMIYGVAC